MFILHDKQMHCEIKEHDFYDNRLLGIYEIAVASNLLYKTGNPLNKEEIRIVIDGFLEPSLISRLEEYLTYTIRTRTVIRHNCITPIVPVHIVVGSSKFFSYYNEKRECLDSECYLLFSKGLDSLVADFILNREYIVNRVTFPEDYSIYPATNRMYIDTFDNDPWDNYGLYFIYLVQLLNKAVITGIKTISIALNHDDLHGYDSISNTIFHSQCSQSKEFISLFRIICSHYNVDLCLPLELLTRTEICKIIIQNSLDIAHSVSCVFFDKTECGMCFSCFDKLTGLLVAIAELNEITNLKLQHCNGLYFLIYKHNVIMSFRNDNQMFDSLERLPIDYIMKLQVYRIVSDEKFSIVFSSKYSVINTLKTLHYYSNHEIGKKLFPEASSFFEKCQDQHSERIQRFVEYCNDVYS